MKKLLSIILSLVMMLAIGVFAVACDGDKDGSSDTSVITGTFEFKKEYDEDAEDYYFVVTGYNVSDEDAETIASGEYESLMRDVCVPCEHKEDGDDKAYPVTEIADGAFTDQLIMRSFSVEKNSSGEYNLKKINSAVFTGCTNLKKVTLPFVGESKDAHNDAKLFGYVFGGAEVEGATSYTQKYNDGDSATVDFYIPNSLSEVIIDGQESIAEYAFYGLAGLTNVKLNGATKVGNYAFYGATGISEIDLSNLDYIGESAFEGCTSLLGATFKNGVKIYNNAFKGCTNLGYGEITEYTLKVNASELGEGAFYGCTSLSNVELTVSTIKLNTFYNCSNLQTVKLNGVTAIQTNAFASCAKLAKAGVSGLNQVTTIYNGAFDFSIDK